MDDEFYLKKVIKLAKIAFSKNEIPVGAIIKNKEGQIIAASYNLSFKKKNQIEHAEMRAIKKACKKINDWRLDNCTLYVNLEPCMMCMGFIFLSRITKVIYTTKSNLFGFNIDNNLLPDLYKKHTKIIKTEIFSNETKNLMQQFFKSKRKS